MFGLMRWEQGTCTDPPKIATSIRGQRQFHYISTADGKRRKRDEKEGKEEKEWKEGEGGLKNLQK